MHISQRIAPCLWFDHQAEEAATFYTSVFKNSKVTSVARYTKAGQEIHKRPSQKAQRAMEALLRMKKIDIRELERAVAGEGVSA